jgi:hypothetical protein
MNVIIQLFVFNLQECQSQYEVRIKEFRMLEYITVLNKNIADKNIKHIHVLSESQGAIDFYTSNIPATNKITFHLVGHQPTYKEFMTFVKEKIPNDEIACIMNADMYFNSENDHNLIQKHLQKHHIFALTRHEITDENHVTHTLDTCPFTGNGGSADIFIFNTPVRESLDISKMDFHQNLFGAEAVFLKPWVDAGYEIWNPCDQIISLHQHINRIHFKEYKHINTPENSAANWKTELPPLPLEH